MTHLTRQDVYNIEDSNIALLGSDLERRVREESGEHEPAWKDAGTSEGLQIWRIEKFQIKPWPKDRHGTFYDGDSYIILCSYKKTPDTGELSYNLHFWLGQNTTQDEAGTAAYKIVELDDLLHGKPVQYREVQGFESKLLIYYFPHFVCMQGGAATGFNHITKRPPVDISKLYRIKLFHSGGHSSLVVREVPASATSLIEGDVYILDKGEEIWQFNTKASAGQERFKAAEFVQNLANERASQCKVTVYDEGGQGAGTFLSEFGTGTTLIPTSSEKLSNIPMNLLRVSDATGNVTFERVVLEVSGTLPSEDVFLLDSSSHPEHPAVFVWIGLEASLNERRLALQYAQNYLYQVGDTRARAAIPIIKMKQGKETDEFLAALDSLRS